MNKLLTIKIISFVVMAIGVISATGWIFHIPILSTAYPTWMQISFPGAISFIVTGIIIHLVSLSFGGHNKYFVFLPFVSTFLFLFTSVFLAASLIGFRTGIGDDFISSLTISNGLAQGGVTSAVTIIAGLALSAIGFLFTLNFLKFKKIYSVLGIVILGIGTTGLLGNIIKLPFLRLTLPGMATQASIPTSLLIISMGFAIYLLSKIEAVEPTSFTTIKSRLIVSVVSISFLSTVFLGVVNITSAGNIIKQEISNKIRLFSEAKEGEIFVYLYSLENRISDFSTSAIIKDNLKKVNAGSPQFSVLISQHLTENDKTLDPNLISMFVLDKKGITVASTKESYLGSDHTQDEDFTIGSKGTSVVNAENEPDYAPGTIIEVATPIFDDKTKEVLGVLVGVFNTEKLGQIMSGNFQLQMGALSSQNSSIQTLRLVLVDKNKNAIGYGNSLPSKNANAEIDTIPVDECLAHGKEISGEYVNHFGVKVIGSSMCIPDRGWTLVAEVDSKEAYSPLVTVQYGLGAITVFIAIFIVLNAIVNANKISDPIKELQEGADKISKGDFDHKVEIKTGDEIEQLANSFNRMATSLKFSREELKTYATGLEHKVFARTKELNDKILDLEKTKTSLSLAKAEDEAILTSIGDAVMACDKDGRVILFNKVAEELTGYSVAEAIGHHFSKCLRFIKESDGTLSINFINEAIETGKKTEMANHCLLVRKDQTTVPISDSASPVLGKIDNVIGCVVVFRDVTKERQIDKVKTEFVSLASHQLRTPLSTINWYVEMLLAGDAGNVTDDQKKYLLEAYGASKRMVELVNALLNVSRLELGSFIIEPVPTDIPELAKTYLKDLEKERSKKNITLNTNFAPEIKHLSVDPKLLGIIFQNVFSNAIKYTPENGKVDISIGHGENEDVLITVSDTGYGIPDSQKERVFEKLFRADNARFHEVEGTGLGLYIVKLILDQAGGKIRFDSEENKGTTFYISLPKSGMAKKEGTKSLT